MITCAYLLQCLIFQALFWSLHDTCTHTHMLIKSTVDPGFTRQLSRSFQSILQEDA